MEFFKKSVGIPVGKIVFLISVIKSNNTENVKGCAGKVLILQSKLKATIQERFVHVSDK